MGKFTMMTRIGMEYIYRHGIHEGYHLNHIARMENGQGFKSLHRLSKDQAQSSRQ